MAERIASSLDGRKAGNAVTPGHRGAPLCLQIVRMSLAYGVEMAPSGSLHILGEHRDAIFVAFAVAHPDGIVRDTESFHPQTQARHQAQSGAQGTEGQAAFSRCHCWRPQL